MASWLVRSSPDPAVRVRALAGDIVLCFTSLFQCLAPPRCINEFIAGITLRWIIIPSRGSRNTPSRFLLHTNRDKLQLDGSLDS